MQAIKKSAYSGLSHNDSTITDVKQAEKAASPEQLKNMFLQIVTTQRVSGSTHLYQEDEKLNHLFE